MALQRRLLLAGVCAITLLTAACQAPVPSTSPGPSVPASTATGAPTSVAPPPTVTPSASGPSASAIAVDPSWRLRPQSFIVWGVSPGDVLNVRTAPGASHPVVATLAPGARGVRLYDATRVVGDARVWSPVQVASGAGWVNLAYLRPQGPDVPAVRGTRTDALATAAESVRRAMAAADFPALAELVDSGAGVSIEGTVVTAAQVRAAASDPTVRTWGFQPATDIPVRATLAEQVRAVAGRTALTSPDVIGFDVRISGPGGIVTDCVAECFPGGHRVEYHYSGSPGEFGGLDWDSVTLVFALQGTGPKLVGLVGDQWEP